MRRRSRRTYVAEVLIAPLLILCLGCKADAIWQRDYRAFLQELVDLASEAKGDNTRGHASQFEGKEVTWVLNFETFRKDKDGNEFLQFAFEPVDLKHVAVVLRFKSVPGTSEGWRATPPGERVKISAVVADVEFDSIPIGNDPAEMIFVAGASLEDVRRVE